jgi:hypothetical protein
LLYIFSVYVSTHPHFVMSTSSYCFSKNCLLSLRLVLLATNWHVMLRQEKAS